MRKTIISICILGLSVLLVSCSGIIGQEDKEYVSVSLSPMTIGLEEESMTKASGTNNVYGLNVYYSADGTDYSNVYAYGLFDNVGDMTISLLTGYYYKFVCTMVKDGKSSLYNSSDVFYYPFQTNNGLYSILENTFVTGGATYFTGLESGNAHLIGGGTPTESNYSSVPGIDRYYGEVSDYRPVAGGSVNIDLKRVVYGVKFVITGMSEGVGNLTVECPGVTVTSDRNGETDAVIRCFSDIKSCWQEDLVTMPVTVKYEMNGLEWVGEDGDLVWTQDVAFKRNYLTTITVNVTFPKGKVEFGLEETLLDENEINLGIGNNGFIDIVVNPS